MARHTFGQLQHLNLSCNLDLTSTFKWVGLDSLWTSQIVQDLIAQNYHLSFHGLIMNLCLVQGLSLMRTFPQAPFLKPSFIDICVAHECCQTRIQTQPNIQTRNLVHHESYPMMVRTWASTKKILSHEGPFKKACQLPFEDKNIVRWIAWTVTVAIFMDYLMKIPCQLMFNINIIKILVIHVIIY